MYTKKENLKKQLDSEEKTESGNMEENLWWSEWVKKD